MKKTVLIVLLCWLSVYGCRRIGPSAREKPLIGITTACHQVSIDPNSQLAEVLGSDIA